MLINCRTLKQNHSVDEKHLKYTSLLYITIWRSLEWVWHIRCNRVSTFKFTLLRIFYITQNTISIRLVWIKHVGNYCDSIYCMSCVFKLAVVSCEIHYDWRQHSLILNRINMWHRFRSTGTGLEILDSVFYLFLNSCCLPAECVKAACSFYCLPCMTFCAERIHSVLVLDAIFLDTKLAFAKGNASVIA